MKRLFCCVFLFAFLFCVPRAHAGGGACPSTANMDGGLYAAPTNCYYVDFANGSDLNTGADEAHPLKHAVEMQGASGNVPTSCKPGDGWIFKGGVTWNYTIWPWYIGAGGGCSGSTSGNDSYGGCTGSSCVYFGIDKSWYTGSVWARPIFSGGDWSDPTVPTCNYDVYGTHPGFQPTNLFNLSYQTDIIIDNFELAGMCTAAQHNYSEPFGNFIESGNGTGGTNFTFENLYIHRSVFSAVCGSTHYCGDFEYAAGFGNETTFHWTYNVVDFSDSGPTATYTQGHTPLDAVWTGEALYQGVSYVDHSVAAYMGDFSSNAWSTLRDNLILQASNESVQSVNDPAASGLPNPETRTHEHIANDSGCVRYGYIYDNVIDTVAAGQTWQQQYGTPNNPCTQYFFNNVVTNQQPGRLFNFGSTSAGITTFMFANTFECGVDTGGNMAGSPPANTCGSWGSSTADYVYNDHFITDNTSKSGFVCGLIDASGPCPSFTDSLTTVTLAIFTSWPGGNPTDLVTQAQAAANGQGYSYTQTYQFSPTSASGATVGKGLNFTAFCNSMLDANASAACKMDTTYAVTYNVINRTAVCCSRVPDARPASGAWDVGAYQYSAASGSEPNAPTGLTATVN